MGPPETRPQGWMEGRQKKQKERNFHDAKYLFKSKNEIRNKLAAQLVTELTLLLFWLMLLVCVKHLVSDSNTPRVCRSLEKNILRNLNQNSALKLRYVTFMSTCHQSDDALRNQQRPFVCVCVSARVSHTLAHINIYLQYKCSGFPPCAFSPYYIYV